MSVCGLSDLHKMLSKAFSVSVGKGFVEIIRYFVIFFKLQIRKEILG